MGARGWQSLTETVARRCRSRGLDIVVPFCVRWYNDAVEPPHRLPDLGRPSALGLLVANTRVLWPIFVAALRRNPARLESEDPLDAYVEAALSEALASVLPPTALRFAHARAPAPIPIQRLAEIAGLAWTAPSRLAVHPRYGPWIALRGAAVLDADGPPGPPPELARPCVDCDRACRPAFEGAVAETGISTETAHGLGRAWTSWLAVRDACPLGRDHRYGDEQIRYHYTKDRTVLLRAVRG
jgi:methylmalonic aciduria homocystinuria type C protein